MALEGCSGYALSGYNVGLSDVGVVFQQIQNLPSNTDDIARIAGMPKNPLTGELKTAGDKLLGEIKNTALKVGKKILKGAVSTGVSAATSLTVGASIGNLIPIPGIGAAIGAIGALVWEGLKALGKALLKFFRPKPEPYQRKCPKFEGCPVMPQMAVVDMIPWLGPQRASIHEKLANQLKKHYCGFGGIRDCASDLSYYWKEAFKVTIDTIPYLGLPQIDRLLLAYRNTPSQFKQLNRRNQIETFTVTEPSTVIYNLEFRRKKLADLMARAQQAATMPSNQVPKLRWDLATELTKAASQVQIAQSPETVGWYKTLGDAVLQLTAREQADSAQLKKHSEDIKKRAANLTPAQALQLRITQQQFLCNEAGGRGKACEELKRLQAQARGGVAPRGPAPARGPAAPPANRAALQQLSQAQSVYVRDYLQWMADKGDKNSALFLLDASRQPGVTPQNHAERVHRYLDQKAKSSPAAKLILFAAVSEFRKSLAS